ncbi:MAG: agmatinase [Candidatus Caldarchaeum sp.]|nr:agmatinase [Candidatus Caldarchaeum sp.]
MNQYEFLLRSRTPFLGIETSFQDAKFFVFGVPYDLSSSFRRGASAGPEAVRKFSANIEANSYRTKADLSAAKIFDGGDVVYDVKLPKMLARVNRVVAEIDADGKIPIMIGGEHTFTYAAVKALKKKASSLIVFDAHFDLRDDYAGLKMNHASYLRRLVEKNPPLPVAVVGVRGYDFSEEAYARERKISYVKACELDDVSRVLRVLSETVAGGRPYISVDIDVFDPAFAPGVGNPEPEGAHPSQIIDLVKFLGKYHPVGFDLMEVNPAFDTGSTAALAARMIFEFMASVEET